jgi:hypothetical protein
MPRKISPVTRPGIDPGTFRLVAQRLKHYATPGPNTNNDDRDNIVMSCASLYPTEEARPAFETSYYSISYVRLRTVFKILVEHTKHAAGRILKLTFHIARHHARNDVALKGSANIAPLCSSLWPWINFTSSLKGPTVLPLESLG